MKANDNLMIMISNGNSLKVCKTFAEVTGKTLVNAYLFITGRMTAKDFYRL